MLVQSSPQLTIRPKDAVSKPGANPRTDPGREVIPLAAPFHNDPVLLAVIDSIIKSRGVRHFVETGTEVGSSLLYMADTYPQLERLYSCEPHVPTYQRAADNLKAHKARVSLFIGKSLDFLARFGEMMAYVMEQPALFWLDAHSHGFGTNLPEEVAFITKNWVGGYILVDDIQVPDHPDFTYDVYQRGALSWELIEGSLAPGSVSQVWWPGYAPAPFPGGRGWLLLAFGAVEPWEPSPALAGKVWRAS